MNDWQHILIPIIAGAGGAIWGYLVGLRRASDAYREAGVQPPIPTPVRERTIEECITAIMTQANYCIDPKQLEGVDIALEALRNMDKRGAGVYGVPRDTADAISRRALDQAAKKEEEG
jgi:hypothetical protein